MALARAGVLPEPAEAKERGHRVGVFVATFAFGLALGAAWEIVEWAFDAFLETKLVPSAQDIALDLLADAVGSLGGGVLLVSWSVLGWSASRDGDPRLSEP